jgi:hypothetical protein
MTGTTGTSSAAGADVHEWISFEDDHELRTWEFDATFLRSDYRCIWGCGCQGVLDEPAEALMQGCCSFGAHFVDEDDVQTVVRAFVQVGPEHMQFHRKAVRGGFLRSGGDGDDAPTTTRVVDGACIFLNRPGFEGGAGCSLHIAATAAGRRPLDWKPNVCWQLPLRLEHFTDDNGHVLSRLREWKRRDWGEGGADFAWWCTEAAEAFDGDEPVYRSMRDEIIELVGSEVYERLVELIDRPVAVPLPHPSVRR